MNTMLTRAEVETRLERGLVGKVITFMQITAIPVSGRLDRLAVEVKDNELIVSFQINRVRYQADLYYFVEYTNIEYGNTNRGDQRSLRRILKGD